MAQISSLHKEAQTSLFFTLPLEIRNHIYELFLPVDTDIWGRFDEESGKYEFYADAEGLERFFLVSCQFSEEARAMIYRANRFHVVLSPALLTHPPWLSDPELPFPIKYLQLMRHVTISYRRSARNKDSTPIEKRAEQLGEFFARFAKECALFRTLAIVFNYPQKHKLSRALGQDQTMAVALASINITDELTLECFSNVKIKKTAFKALRYLIGPDTEWEFCEFFTCNGLWVWKAKSKPLLPTPS